MQYLFKVSISGAPVWRLVALDGRASLSHTSSLLCMAFGYEMVDCYFLSDGKRIYALRQSAPIDRLSSQDLDSFIKENSGVFTFSVSDGVSELSHSFETIRSDEKLSCLIPSCIFGAGKVPPHGPYNPGLVSAFAQDEANRELDLRVVTKRMRALGSVQPPLEKALADAGIAPIPFKTRN